MKTTLVALCLLVAVVAVRGDSHEVEDGPVVDNQHSEYPQRPVLEHRPEHYEGPKYVQRPGPQYSPKYPGFLNDHEQTHQKRDDSGSDSGSDESGSSGSSEGSDERRKTREMKNEKEGKNDQFYPNPIPMVWVPYSNGQANKGYEGRAHE